MLGDLLEVAQSGFACGKEDATGVFQFRMHNVSNASGLSLDKRRRVPRDANKRMADFEVIPGDVLFNATNSPDGVGKSIVVPVLDEPAVFSNHFLRLRPKRNSLDSVYLWRWLQFQFQRGVFRAMCRQWVNQATVSRDSLLGLNVPTPPVEDQRRIAVILDQAEAIRVKRRQVFAHLDTLTQSIFHDMFGNPNTNSRRLPRATIGSVAEVVTGNSPSRADSTNFGDAIEWIKSDNLGGSVATHAGEWLSERALASARIAPAGSILVTCIAGSPASIGKSSLVDRDVAFNQQINAIIPSSMLDAQFILWQLRTAPDLVRAKTTGGMKGLVSKSSFQSIEILLPDFAIQRKFATQVEQINAQRTVVQQALVADDELFASLQSRAFKGEL
jgi:type I restriction enzyme, S subunit